ncbi:MAG TPA: efflux RND transporter periplasmic adaptor subunit, partial [Gemmataceae bacterium]|nr:efflux RND transporter periplasmic adaptor subunit [Gemmataceae bacterium]
MKRSFQALAGLLLCSLVLSGCGPSGNASNSHAPEKPKVESDLPVITLNAEAYKSLRIVSEPIHTEKIQEFLQLTGWIMAPQGKEVTITAPVAGYVRLSDKLKRSPIRGENVDSGKELFNLEPVLSPVEEIQLKILKQGVESELKKTLSTYQNAEKELKRTKDLMKKGLSTQQELDQKQVRFDLAEEDLKAARKKQEFFQNPTRSILARQPGSVLQVHVSPGQYVAAAAPLVTIADLKQLWVRVPIPELDFPSVEAKKEVSVRLKGMNQTSGTDKNHRPAATFKAEPVAMVPQVDTVKHTVDVIYQLMPGPRGISFAKDQMVTVFVPLGKERVESVVPYSAVVFDAFGGSWIYLDRGADKGGHKFHFERRRVELGATVTIKGKDGKAMDRVVIRPSGR